MTLAEKRILVIGANGLLGVRMALAIQQAGAEVVALDIAEHPQASLQQAGIRYVRGSASANAILDPLLAEGFDGAVNLAYPRNSAYGRDFCEVQLSDFQDNVSQHLGLYFQVMQRCYLAAKARQQAFSLVNFSSIYGQIAPRFDVYEQLPMTMPVEYAAIKAGVQHLTRYLTNYAAHDADGLPFRVNCVAPGGIEDGQHAQFQQNYRRYCNSKGMLNADDISGSVIFLLSDAARYICGQTLTVDDGFST